MAVAAASARVALIIGSTRSTRVGPEIARFVSETVNSHLSTAGSTSPSLDVVDLADHPLPSSLDNVIPMLAPTVDTWTVYTRPEAQEWSKLIASFDGFIFVTPQYNWGYPGPLKNALDHLFHEWTRKPAAVVSYGGQGGGKAGDALRDVLSGLRMRVVKSKVEITLGKSMQIGMTTGKLVEGQHELWRDEGVVDSIITTWTELEKLLREGKNQAA